MSKVKTKIFIHYRKYSWDEKGEYAIFSYRLNDGDTLTFICEQEIEIEVPDNYEQIAALEKQKQKVMAEFQVTVDAINEKISKLQAITYTA